MAVSNHVILQSLANSIPSTVLATFVSGYLLDRIKGNYITIFGICSALIANLLFAVPIPPETTYWAYGFPAMSLMAFGVDTVFPCLGLFTTQALPRKDQALAGAMYQTVSGVGRSIGSAIAAAIQTAVQNRQSVRSYADQREAFLKGLRAALWFDVGVLGVCLVVTVVGLRNIGKIGLLKKLGSVEIKDDDRERAHEQSQV